MYVLLFLKGNVCSYFKCSFCLNLLLLLNICHLPIFMQSRKPVTFSVKFRTIRFFMELMYSYYQTSLLVLASRESLRHVALMCEVLFVAYHL